ncbi:hypothetical protein FHS85_001745 [Rhodoligotrophos appendicifer]|uniref:hypothetical protein n=1 Tax=Rhodoligotrophos appendicifer TaxID=987056 RepID=UPI001960D745|nr:hypothetical protein [Rhodoligotrophos appendicifer]
MKDEQDDSDIQLNDAALNLALIELVRFMYNHLLEDEDAEKFSSNVRLVRDRILSDLDNQAVQPSDTEDSNHLRRRAKSYISHIFSSISPEGVEPTSH